MSYTEAQEVYPNIFLGSIFAANNKKWLKDNNITYILSLVNPGNKIDGINYQIYNKINDTPEQDILHIFGECFKFIDNALINNSKILIHCYAGISRSATILIGYLIYKLNMSFDDISNHIIKKRKIVHPNYGFYQQLKKFETMNINKRIDYLNHYPL